MWDVVIELRPLWLVGAAAGAAGSQRDNAVAPDTSRKLCVAPRRHPAFCEQLEMALLPLQRSGVLADGAPHNNASASRRRRFKPSSAVDETRVRRPFVVRATKHYSLI